MKPGERLPLLTEVLVPAGQDAIPGAASSPDAAMPAASRPAAPGTAAASALSDQMARAVLELELEQALREVLEPRLAVLLREAASELAQRLQLRMRDWMDERGAGG